MWTTEAADETSAARTRFVGVRKIWKRDQLTVLGKKGFMITETETLVAIFSKERKRHSKILNVNFCHYGVRRVSTQKQSRSEFAVPEALISSSVSHQINRVSQKKKCLMWNNREKYWRKGRDGCLLCSETKIFGRQHLVKFKRWSRRNRQFWAVICL